MNEVNPKSTAKIAGHPIHPMLIPLPMTFFIGAAGTDIGYLVSNDRAWALATMWMLGAGLVTAAAAALTGFIDFFGDKRVRGLQDAWMHMIGNLVAVALEAVNLYWRTLQGAEASVAPVGVTLSIVVVLVLGFTGWKGGDLVYKHRVGIPDQPER